jgi:hypothetical protein
MIEFDVATLAADATAHDERPGRGYGNRNTV